LDHVWLLALGSAGFFHAQIKLEPCLLDLEYEEIKFLLELLLVRQNAIHFLIVVRFVEVKASCGFPFVFIDQIFQNNNRAVVDIFQLKIIFLWFFELHCWIIELGLGFGFKVCA
jgi:hypothetical protein